MIVKVKLRGNGTAEDPHRVALPTYRLIMGHVTEGWAYALIPNSDVHGLSQEELDAETAHATTEGTHYVLSEETLNKVHAHFDEHYQEHKGKFRIEQV